MTNDFLTLTEAARVLGVSRQTLYNRLLRGTAPPHQRVAGRWLFDPATLARTSRGDAP